jgi:citrate lyase beta subunit
MAEQVRQGVLFDLEAGQAMKRDALERFEAKAQDWLARARQAAVEICRRKGTVTSDDVLEAVGMPDGLHRNVIGAIFGRGFVRVGFRRTRRPEGHARLIGVWKLKQGGRW